MTVTLTIDIKKSLKKDFKKTCLENDESMKDVIIEFIIDYTGWSDTNG